MRLIDADDLHEIEPSVLCSRDYARGYNDSVREAKTAPTVDAVPISIVNDDVDEALRLLDAINSGGYIDYGVYCDLHNAICAIATHCGAKVDKEDGNENS